MNLSYLILDAFLVGCLDFVSLHGILRGAHGAEGVHNSIDAPTAPWLDFDCICRQFAHVIRWKVYLYITLFIFIFIINLLF